MITCYSTSLFRSKLSDFLASTNRLRSLHFNRAENSNMLKHNSSVFTLLSLSLVVNLSNVVSIEAFSLENTQIESEPALISTIASESIGDWIQPNDGSIGNEAGTQGELVNASSTTPSQVPTSTPSTTPSITPSVSPSSTPSSTPSMTPSTTPSLTPSSTPSVSPTTYTTITWSPSQTPSAMPSEQNSSATPTLSSTHLPTIRKTMIDFPDILNIPSGNPSSQESETPTSSNTFLPTAKNTIYFPGILNSPSTFPSSYTLNNFISTPKSAATTVRFQGISEEMPDIDKRIFESVVEFFVDETKYDVSPTVVTVQSVLVTKQRNGANNLDVSFVVSGEMTYNPHLRGSLSYEEIVLAGFTNDFNKFVRYLSSSSVFFQGMENTYLPGPSFAQGEGNSVPAGSASSKQRNFAEGGLTKKEILIVVGGLSGFLVFAAFTYKTATSFIKQENSSNADAPNTAADNCGMSIFDVEVDNIGNVMNIDHEITKPKSFEVDLEIQKKPSDVSDLSHWTMENACRKAALSCNMVSCFAQDVEKGVSKTGTSTGNKLSEQLVDAEQYPSLSDIVLSEDGMPGEMTQNDVVLGELDEVNDGKMDAQKM